jgi:hypothetical protein
VRLCFDDADKITFHHPYGRLSLSVPASTSPGLGLTDLTQRAGEARRFSVLS